QHPGAVRRHRGILLTAVCLAVVGCGGSQGGVDVWGEVNFNGKPVPAGRIYFNPDVCKGNKGPQGYAGIPDRKFDTRKGGKGACAGPTVVVINGNEAGKDPASGSMGIALFKEYQITIDLPSSPCEKSFDVPTFAAKDLPKTPTTRKPP